MKDTTMATPTSNAGPGSTSSAVVLGQTVFFYADHKSARGMKSMDDSEPFVALVVSPRNDGSGFSVPVTAATPIVEPSAPPSLASTSPPLANTTGSATPAPAPIATGGGITGFGEIVGGESYRNGVYKDVPLIGGSGKGAKATITVAGNVVTAVVPSDTSPGVGYVVGDELSATLVDRLVNVLVIDHRGHTFALESVPLFQGDDGDDKAAPFHCEPTYRKVEKPVPASASVKAASGAAASGATATLGAPATPTPPPAAAVMGAPPPAAPPVHASA
jgi:hypothetical protein